MSFASRAFLAATLCVSSDHLAAQPVSYDAGTVGIKSGLGLLDGVDLGQALVSAAEEGNASPVYRELTTKAISGGIGVLGRSPALAVAVEPGVGQLVDILAETLENQPQGKTNLEKLMSANGVSVHDLNLPRPSDLGENAYEKLELIIAEEFRDVLRDRAVGNSGSYVGGGWLDQYILTRREQVSSATVSTRPSLTNETVATIEDPAPNTTFEEGPETQWCINSCLSTTGRDPASSAYKQCVSSNCYAEQSPATPTANNLSNAAQYLINERVAYGCQNQGGEFNLKGVTVVDLNGDGKDDLVLDDGWISCRGSTQASSISCGARACEVAIYLRRGELLKLEIEYLSIGVEVGTGSYPTISGQNHNLSEYRFGWNGSEFSSR